MKSLFPKITCLSGKTARLFKENHMPFQGKRHARQWKMTRLSRRMARMFAENNSPILENDTPNRGK
jgi:hypothetical protein